MQRPGSASEYAWLDGSPVEQGVASDSAYPHWAWLQPQLANTSGADCVAAWSNYQYERFLGDASNSSHVRSAGFYQTGSADRLFAWGAQPCAMRFATICAVPASAFPCYPPPSPPPPPPQPPSPPTPPLQPSCAPRTSASFYCDAQFGMCYNYTGTAAFFSNARTSCQQQGGELVKLDRWGHGQLHAAGRQVAHTADQADQASLLAPAPQPRQAAARGEVLPEVWHAVGQHVLARNQPRVQGRAVAVHCGRR
jgi:hypothetical protein